MQQTLFHIRESIGGWPLFGGPFNSGLLLLIWAIGSVALLAWLINRQGFNADTKSYLPLLGMMGGAILFLLPALSDPGRGVPIRGYGVMVLLGVGSGAALSVYRGRLRGFDSEILLSLAFWLFISGMVGARAFYVIQKWDDDHFHKDTLLETIKAVVNISQGGLVVFGSLIAMIPTAIIFFRKYRLPILPTADVIAPGALLALGIGRIGCLMNGCCFAAERCDLPWAVTFPAPSPPFERLVNDSKIATLGVWLPGDRQTPEDQALPPVISKVEPDSQAASAGLKAGQLITSIRYRDAFGNSYEHDNIRTVEQARNSLIQSAVQGTQVKVLTSKSNQPHEWTVPVTPRTWPVQPTQVYSAIDAVLLSLFLLAYSPFRRREGELFVLLLALHGVSRFLLESIRTDETKNYLGLLSVSQLISVCMLAAAAALFAFIMTRPKRQLAGAPAMLPA